MPENGPNSPAFPRVKRATEWLQAAIFGCVIGFALAIKLFDIPTQSFVDRLGGPAVIMVSVCLPALILLPQAAYQLIEGVANFRFKRRQFASREQ